MIRIRIRRHSKRTSAHQNGFSLVEVLIALIIMSVGMLGIASLYVQSMQAGRMSLFRHHAVTLAGDIADRIRANRTAGAVYEDPAGANHNCIAGGTNCSAQQMAMHDILIWKQQSQATLPNGDVVVTFNGGPTPPTYTIQIIWDEPGLQQNYTIQIPVSSI